MIKSTIYIEDPFDEFLKKNLPIVVALDAPPVTSSERSRERFERDLVKNFGHVVSGAAESRPWGFTIPSAG